MHAVLLIHLAVTWALVGLIWVVQLVHYPLFAAVGREAYVAYQREHMQRITWIVAPLMLTELATAVLLVMTPPAGAASWMAPTGLGLVIVAWVSTLALQVPMHARLEAGFDAGAHRRLVAGNWVRAAAWSLRGVLVLGWIA